MARKTKAIAQSPLAGFDAIERDDYQQREIFPLGKLIIRGKGDNSAFVSAAEDALGAALPLTPNSATAISDSSTALWLGPEEWLLWANDRQFDKKFKTLQEGLSSHHAAVIDVSDYYTIIRIGGDKAAQVLAHGCPLDMRDKRFTVNSCAQSHYRNAGILLYRRKNGYDVQVRWSFAQYLWEYFAKVSALLVK